MSTANSNPYQGNYFRLVISTNKINYDKTEITCDNTCIVHTYMHYADASTHFSSPSFHQKNLVLPAHNYNHARILPTSSKLGQVYEFGGKLELAAFKLKKPIVFLIKKHMLKHNWLAQQSNGWKTST